MKEILRRVTASLTNDLRAPKYRRKRNRLAGHCYVTAEALFHILGGPFSGWVPQYIRHEGDSHWYLRHSKTGEILDLTASQFRRPVPYEKGVGKGFLTKVPSKRAQIVIERCWRQHVKD